MSQQRISLRQKFHSVSAVQDAVRWVWDRALPFLRIGWNICEPLTLRLPAELTGDMEEYEVSVVLDSREGRLATPAMLAGEEDPIAP